MKVLMLSWEFPPKIMGGLGVVVRDISKHLILKGIDVKVILPYDPGNKEEIFQGKIYPLSKTEMEFGAYTPIKYIKHAIKGKSFLEMVEQYKKRCLEKCKDIEFDIIHAHDWLTFPAAIEIKKALSKPLIVHIHSTEFDRAGGGRGNELVHKIEYEGLKYADKIIAVSNLVKDWIVNHYGIEESKVEVIHNAIDYQPKDQRNIKENSKKIVMYVGRLSWMKGVDCFLRCAKKVLEYEDAYFVIVGKGEIMEDLIEEAVQLGISNRVFFTGHVPREKIIEEYYPMADVLVIPSRSEPFGLIALEAAYHALPIIVSKQSGVSEILEHALKVDYWDIDKMATKILALLRHPPLKHELGKNALQTLKYISWTNQVEKIINVYRGVM